MTIKINHEGPIFLETEFPNEQVKSPQNKYPKFAMLWNANLSEHQYDTTNWKFYTWSHVTDWSQNIGISHKITFRLCL
jgi:hypothetical protein